MARKLDLAQLRQAKNNQFKPNEPLDLDTTPKEKTIPKKISISPKSSKVESTSKKAGRPFVPDKKPTKATSIRLHPDLVDIPKILAGISRKNVFSLYNEIIVDALLKYKKKYPQLLDDLKIPPKKEL